jgi:hypothetical protein
MTNTADLKAAIRSILLSDTDVAAIVGTRVYSPWLPQTAEYPCITLSVIDHQENINIDSARTTLRVTSWAKESGVQSGDRISADLSKKVQYALYGKKAVVSITRPDGTAHSIHIKWIDYYGGISLFDTEEQLSYVNDRFPVNYRGD